METDRKKKVSQFLEVKGTMNTKKSIAAVLLLVAVLALVLTAATTVNAQGPDSQKMSGKIMPFVTGPEIGFVATLPVSVTIGSDIVITHHYSSTGMVQTFNSVETSLGQVAVQYGAPNSALTLKTEVPGVETITGTLFIPNIGFGTYTTTVEIVETPCWALENYTLYEAMNYYTLAELQQCPGWNQLPAQVTVTPIIVPSDILTATPEPTVIPPTAQSQQAPSQPTPNTQTQVSPTPVSNPQTNNTAQSKEPTVLYSFDVNDQHPWPATNPMQNATVATVGACQTSVGIYDANSKERWFNIGTPALWTAMSKFCLSGGVWLKDFAPQGIVIEDVSHLLGTTVTTAGNTTTNVNLGKCGSLLTRNARLHCATDEYWAHGIGLEGFKAMLTSFNATFTSLVFSYEDDDWQPDSDMYDNVETFWGGLGNFVGLHVTGNTVIVTDDPKNVSSYEWAMQDLRGTKAPIWHFGGATTPNDREVRVAVHLDGSDWQEIAAAMKCKCVIVTQKDGSFGPK